MTRLLASVALALSLLCAGSAHAAPTEVRTWAYTSYNLVSPAGWGLTVMPGVRFEWADSEGDAGGLAMTELFAGPFLHHKWERVKLTLPLWYYRMDFPVGGDHYRSHNIELIPMVSMPLTGALTLHSRTILHNKVHASNPVFTTASQRTGYSLLVREMLTLQIGPEAWKGWSILVSDEAFVGLVEDGETNDLVRGEPFFEKHGFSLHRVYLGVKKGFALGSAPVSLTVDPQYVFETHHDPSDGGALTRVRHYGYVHLKLTQVMVGR